MREVILLINLIVPIALFALVTIAGVAWTSPAGKIDWSIAVALGSGALWIWAGIALLRRYLMHAWAISLIGWAAVIVGALRPGVRMMSLIRRARFGDPTAELEPSVGMVLLGSMLAAIAASAAFVAVASLPRRRWGPDIPPRPGAPPVIGGTGTPLRTPRVPESPNEPV